MQINTTFPFSSVASSPAPAAGDAEGAPAPAAVIPPPGPSSCAGLGNLSPSGRCWEALVLGQIDNFHFGS